MLLLDDLQLTAPGPPKVLSGAVQTIGTAGVQQLYYWVVAHFPIGICISGPFVVRNAPDTLSATDRELVVWEGPVGAEAYDVLRTSTSDFPGAPGLYAVALDLTDTFFEDIGDPLQFYDPTGLPWGAPVARNVHLNNRDYNQPTIEIDTQLSLTQIVFPDGSVQSVAGFGPDAPVDGVCYGREDEDWVPVVRIAGSTMTGPLILSEDPIIEDYQATTKQYVDSTFVTLAGSTMTGPLILSDDPITEDRQATTKEYVDSFVYGTDAPADGICYGRQDNQWVPAVRRSGDSMTGPLSINASTQSGLTVSAGNLIDSTVNCINSQGGPGLAVVGQSGFNGMATFGSGGSGGTWVVIGLPNTSGVATGAVSLSSYVDVYIQSVVPAASPWAPLVLDINGLPGFGIRASFDGTPISGIPQARFFSFIANGQYGWRNFFYTLANTTGTLQTQFAGDLIASAFTQSSDLALKQDIAEPSLDECAGAFAGLRPRKFRRKPLPLAEGQTVPSPVGRLEWGLIANELERTAPEAVSISDGLRGYSITDVLAIAIGKIRHDEQRIVELEHARISARMGRMAHGASAVLLGMLHWVRNNLSLW